MNETEVFLGNPVTLASKRVLVPVLVAFLRLFADQPGIDHPVETGVQPTMIDILQVEVFKCVLEANAFNRPESADETEEMGLKGGEVCRYIIRRKIN